VLRWPWNIAGSWNPARLSGDQFRSRLATRLAGFFKQLALGAGPVLQRISRCAAALQIDLVGAQRDFFPSRTHFSCPRLFHGWRGTLPILGHALPLSTAAPILQLMERHLLEIRLRWHRKIQSFKSKKSEVASARTVLETCGAGNLGAPRIQ